MKRIILAYSGGLETSVAIPWLAETYGADVIAVTLDLGQERELSHMRERALALGAVRAHVIDAREELARDFILPTLQAGALYEGRYPLAAALGRPLIARRLVEMAKMEGATAIAHGCIGATNDQVRLELSIRLLDPAIKIIAAARSWGMTRAEAIEYARARKLPLASTAEAEYSIDANLWGRSVARGVLDDPWVEPPDEIYRLTRSPQETPDEPAYVEVEFESGVPVRTNGVDMPMVELIESLDTIAGAHGVGRIDMVESSLASVKSREIYEAPAATVLHTAHNDLASIVTGRSLDRLAKELGRAYADLVYNGEWFTQTRQAIDAFMGAIQPSVTGSVRLKLFKGQCLVVGRKSPHALYDHPLPALDARVTR
ncbi:MAG TPA: argininosuccinate synthase [Vicinamibacterales bacterium]